MKDPFIIEEILPDIYRITESFFSEHANLYLIKGRSEDLLIDAGLGAHDIKQFLKEKGFTPRLFLTHSHFDHAGGARHFLPSEIVAAERTLGNMEKKELQGLEYLKAEFFDPKFESCSERSAEEFCLTFRMSVPPATPFEDQRIDVGDYAFDVMHTPGHTDDSVVLYDRKHKILISGDTLYDGEPYADFPNSDRAAFMQSLIRLGSLDVETTLPGHNDLLKNDRTRLVLRRWMNELNKFKTLEPDQAEFDS
ncbi:MAG TPA: MBL fold metallo-hydrolase [Candidatus Paceibacterota bacterium]|nr:MBL fold metallo-hydrolase [Candidatus Paceibacterota bacterium]